MFLGPEIASGVRSGLTMAGSLLAAGRVFFATPAGQQVANTVADALAPPGSPSFSVGNATSGLGFAEGKFQTVVDLIGGELQNAGSAMLSVAKTESNLSVGISMVSGPAGTLSKLESNVLGLAKSDGASSVTFTGKMASAAMGKLLGRNGLTQVVKDGVKTNDWTKTVKVQ